MRNVSVGEAPAHVMTRTDTDQVHVTNNGDIRTDAVMELSPLATGVERRIDIGRGNPHAHWMSHDGHKMVTPNVLTGDTTQYDFPADRMDAILSTGNPFSHPIATGMMPDASKYYVGNLLDSTISVIDMHTNTVIDTINLIANYDPVSGAITGPVGALPIQTPVSPDGRHMVTANMLTETILVTNTQTDTVVAMLGCDPGCHGVQYGAKQGGGYYAYVSSKFSNRLLVVDPDPNGDGNPADAAMAGSVGLFASRGTLRDAAITGKRGHGRAGSAADPGRLQRLGAESSGVVEEPPDAGATQPVPVTVRRDRGYFGCASSSRICRMWRCSCAVDEQRRKRSNGTSWVASELERDELER